MVLDTDTGDYRASDAVIEPAVLEVMKKVVENHKDFISLKDKFNKKLNTTLDNYPIRVKSIENGLGYFEGDIPNHIAKLFKASGSGFIVCPSRSSMEEFLNE